MGIPVNSGAANIKSDKRWMKGLKNLLLTG